MRRGIPGFGPNRFQNAAIVVGIIFIAVLLIGGASRLGGGSSGVGDYPEDVQEFLRQSQPEVTATRLIDPWISPSPGITTPASGRLIAIEVTIEHPRDRAEIHYVTSSNLRLVDSEGFVYGAIPSEIESALREGLQLSPGQKTRGWVLFEIDADTEIQSLAYGLDEVSLPEPEAPGGS